MVIIKTISIRREPWAHFNYNHPPFKRQPSIFRAANYHLKIFFDVKTGPRTHWSGTHSIPVSETCRRNSRLVRFTLEREKSIRIIAGRTEIAEFSNVGVLQVMVRR